MAIPNEIPANARVVVRVSEGVDPTDHRMKYRDYVGHVTSWAGHTLDMIRDAAANGSRPEHRVTIDADTIITLKPVPERHFTCLLYPSPSPRDRSLSRMPSSA